MIKIDEDALICDFAEYYHIYNYKQLPLSTVAVFACGLRFDSRIQMKLNNWNIDLKTQIMAGIYDIANTLLWTKTKDAQKGSNRPMSLSKELNNNRSQSDKEIVFNSGEEFEETRKKLMKGGN